MTFAGVADTHAAIWFALADLRLSSKARMFIESVVSDGLNIAISPISLSEIVCLRGEEAAAGGSLQDATNGARRSRPRFKEVPFTADVAEAMLQVSRDAIPDMPDRIVAATTAFRSPVLSRDGRIQASTIATILVAAAARFPLFLRRSFTLGLVLSRLGISGWAARVGGDSHARPHPVLAFAAGSPTARIL